MKYLVDFKGQRETWPQSIGLAEPAWLYRVHDVLCLSSSPLPSMFDCKAKPVSAGLIVEERKTKPKALLRRPNMFPYDVRPSPSATEWRKLVCHLLVFAFALVAFAACVSYTWETDLIRSNGIWSNSEIDFEVSETHFPEDCRPAIVKSLVKSFKF